MSIVDLETAKLHLRYDDTTEDIMIQGYLDAAESAVTSYITDEFQGEYPKAIHQAILILVGYFDQFRNAESEAPTDGNYLPVPVRMLLYPYRKPTAV